jgi:DNA primase
MSLKLLLDKAFGEAGTELRNGEVAYHCPFCKHHKKKLQVNLNNHNWKCWICKDTNKTVGKTIKTLFKKMKVLHRFADELKKYKINTYDFSGQKEDAEMVLPDEFESLTKKSWMPEYKHALKYLSNRGIGPLEIIKYNIGFCGSGRYKNRIIIPSYNKDGQLNYFVSRTWIKDHPLKYLNPPTSKEIIGFEMLVNWNMEITLCEGIFDAMAIKRNAIPLFGKTMNDVIKENIIKFCPSRVNVCLDSDAKESALIICEWLSQFGITCHLILFDEKDPSDMGYLETWKHIRESKPFSFTQHLLMKL